MAKAKLRFVVEVEYEIHPEYYEEGSTLEQMLAVDISNANEDPYLSIGDNGQWTVTGEIIQ